MTYWQCFSVALGGVLVMAFVYLRTRRRSNVIMSKSRPGNQLALASDRGAPSPNGPETSG
jgi:hypothetical protein